MRFKGGFPTIAAEIDEAADRISSLLSENTRLREALEPLKKLHDKYEAMFASIPVDRADNHLLDVSVTLGSLRRARAALASAPRNESEDLVQITPQDTGSVTAAPSEWQPIETAPKDGTFVLVCLAGGPAFDAYWEARGRVTATDEPGWCDGASSHTNGEDWLLVYYPDFWMPLPSPPTSSEERQRSDTSSPQVEQQPDTNIQPDAGITARSSEN